MNHVRAIFHYLHFGQKYIPSIFVPAYPVQGHTRAQACIRLEAVYIWKRVAVYLSAQNIHICIQEWKNIAKAFRMPFEKLWMKRESHGLSPSFLYLLNPHSYLR